MRVRYPMILVLTTALALGTAASAPAALYGFSTDLSGLSENPPNASPAFGHVILIYDSVANTLTTSGTFSGLLGSLTNGHIHGPALPAANAGVVHGFAGLPIGATSGSFTDVWSGLSAQNLSDLNAGLYYVNLHSQVFGGGEIRGQVHEDATPSRAVSWGRIKALYR